MENGKIAIVENLKNGIGFGSTEFHVIRLFGNDISRTYIFYFILQENFRKNAQRCMTGSAGQLRVPAEYLRQTLIPLPPLAEQHRIVAEVERRLSIADGVEKTAGQSLAQAQRLRQSILKKAFEGRLVAQDATDEPAGVLLERIKAEKARMGKNKTKSRVTKDL
jgi:type I restriction enzyme S subunit